MREPVWWRRLGRLVKRKAVEWWEPEPFLVDMWAALWDGFRANWRQIVGLWAILVLFERFMRDESIADAVKASTWLALILGLIHIGPREAVEGDDDNHATNRSLENLSVSVHMIVLWGLAAAYTVDRYSGSPALVAAGAAAIMTLGTVMELKTRAKARRESAEP